MSMMDTCNPDENALSKQLSLVPPVPVLRQPSLASRALERVIPEKSKFLMLLWLIAIAAVVALFSNIQGEATQFYGIAESEQQSISFQYPVEVVEVPVVEGQIIAEHVKLLRVRRYDLEVGIGVINEKINEIEAERDATRHNATAEIASLQAEREARIESINTNIDSLESRHKLNQALANSISINAAGENAVSESPILAKLGGLRSEKKLLSKMFQARIELQKQVITDISGPSEARVAELNRQKSELLRQGEALVVHAPFAGSVGSVMFKPGEQVDAFNPVISVHGSSTRHIKGFIHEAVINDIRVGQHVWVKALGAVSDDTMVGGVVESLGSRIVEYPERLKRSLLVSAWGREAVIRIAPDNNILLGEKVSVFLKRPQPMLASALAYLESYLPISVVRATALAAELGRSSAPEFIDVKIEGLTSKQVEASGITWNPASQSYLLVSDEQSALFEMNAMGEIVARYPLDRVDPIDDLESISRDGNHFFVAASLSPNKQRKLKTKRRRLMRLQVDTQGISAGDSIDLYAVLQGLRDSSRLDTVTRSFIDRGLRDQSLDLEAHAVVDNSLYLGFKAPFDIDGNTVIFKLENVDALFAGEPVTLASWQRLKLEDPDTGIATRLSDFTLTPSAMYLLSIGQHGGRVTSYLWRYDIARQRLEIITEYPGLRAEGLSIDDERAKALVVFDGSGKWPSQFLRTRI